MKWDGLPPWPSILEASQAGCLQRNPLTTIYSFKMIELHLAVSEGQNWSWIQPLTVCSTISKCFFCIRFLFLPSPSISSHLPQTRLLIGLIGTWFTSPLAICRAWMLEGRSGKPILVSCSNLSQMSPASIGSIGGVWFSPFFTHKHGELSTKVLENLKGMSSWNAETQIADLFWSQNSRNFF